VPKYNTLQHKNKHLEQHDWPRIRDRKHTANRVEANCIWRRWNGWKCPLLIRMLSAVKCFILNAPSKWNLIQPIIFTYISRIIFVWKFIQIFTQCNTFIIFRTPCKWQFTLNIDYSLRSHNIFTQEKRPSEFISVDTNSVQEHYTPNCVKVNCHLRTHRHQ